jgi:hypothetical protein
MSKKSIINGNHKDGYNTDVLNEQLKGLSDAITKLEIEMKNKISLLNIMNNNKQKGSKDENSNKY